MRFSLGLDGGKLDWYDAELVDLYPTIDGGLRIPTKDLSPGINWAETERAGDPVGWIALGSLFRAGWWPYSTMPGRRVQTSPPTIPDAETRPPRDAFLFNQAPTPVPLHEAWVADQVVQPGTQPMRFGAADLPPPLTPVAVAVARSRFGLKGARYGWAYGFADERKRLTPSSAYAFTDGPIGEGQGLMLILPDVSGVDAPFLYFALTLPDGGRATGRVMGFVHLEALLTGEHPFPGPLKDGPRPPDKNQTGVGKLPPPNIGESRPGSRSRAWVDERRGPRNLAIQPGRWRFYSLVRPKGRGPSMPGAPSREIQVDEEKPGKVFHYFAPRNLPEDWEFGCVVQIIPLTPGAPAYYQVGMTSLGGGRDMWFKRGSRAWQQGLKIWGYPGDAAPGRPEHRLYIYEPPDPNDSEADGTVIPAPDATQPPDAPYGYGIPQMVPGSYKGAASDATEGYPGEGPVSPSTPEVSIASGQTMKLRRPSRLTCIPNAEGNERAPDGTPLEWTSGNLVAPVTEKIEDGVWEYSASTNVASGTGGANYWHRTSAEWELPNGANSVFTVVGTMEVVTHFVGASEAVLQFVDDAGAVQGTTVLSTEAGELMRLNGTGLRTLMHRGMRFGPGYSPIPENATKVRLRFRPQLDLVEWRQVVRFYDFQIFSFGEALRKTVETLPDADDEAAGVPPADPDAATPATPFPQQSEWRLGPAPQVPGASVVEPEEPLGVWDFAGIAAGGSPPASIGTLINAPSGSTHVPVVEDDPTSPTGTEKRLRIFDNSTSSRAMRSYQKTYTDADIGGAGALATRILFRVPTTTPGLPTRNFLREIQILDQNGNPFAVAGCNYQGTIYLQRLKPNGDVVQSVAVASGASAGSLVDLELAVAEENSKNGVIRCSAGINRPRNRTQSIGGLDFTGRKPRIRRFGGVLEMDNAAKWALWIYSVVDTKGGDILSRENPATGGIASTPPDPDAPLKVLPPAWAAKVSKAVNDQVVPTVKNGRMYGATVAPSGALTGTQEPLWPTTDAATVTDNRGMSAVGRNQALALGSGYLKPGGASTDAEWYEVTEAGTTDPTTPPAYPTTAGQVVQDGADVAQVDTVEIVAANSFTYQVTINGTTITYTSDADATEGEIALGLVAAINASSQAPNVTAATSALATDAAANFTVTADSPGTPFTMTVGTNLTSSTTTANRKGARLTCRKTITWQERGTIWRLFDVRNNRLNQWVGIIEPGLGMNNGYGPRTRRPIVVKPGVTYTQAAQDRHLLLQVPDDPTHQLFVVLTKEGGRDPIWVGSPFGPGADAAAVSRVAGVRSQSGGMAAREDWAEEDFWHHFTVPAWDPDSGELPYTEAHIGPVNDCEGLYWMQEHGFWEGALTTQEQRDAARDYGRIANSGTFRAVVDTQLVGMELTPELASVQKIVSFGAAHADPNAASLPWTARSTDQRDPYGGWSQESADPDATPSREVFQIAGTLSGDPEGDEWPEIPPGGIFVETRPIVPVLLDQHRQPIAGMILAGDAEVFRKSEQNEEPVNGHAFSVRLSDEVEALDPMALVAMTVDGWRFLKEITANTVVTYEDPQGGDDGTGRIYTIRFYSRLQVERRKYPVRLLGGIKRAHALVAETPEAEILEIAEMGPARGF